MHLPHALSWIRPSSLKCTPFNSYPKNCPYLQSCPFSLFFYTLLCLSGLPLGVVYGRLVDEFSVKGNTDRSQEEASVLVGGGAGVDGDVAAGDFLWGVPGFYVSGFVLVGFGGFAMGLLTCRSSLRFRGKMRPLPK